MYCLLTMIYCNDNIKNGRPLVQGSKIGVHQVYEMSKSTSVEKISEEYNNLTVDKVEYAIKYAQDNEDEMKRIKEDKQKALDELQDESKAYYINKL